jgi:hypothetical protein
MNKRGFRYRQEIKNKHFLLNKRGFEFSFTWIFAIIVGAMILFLAIYGATKFIQSGQYSQGTKTAKELTIIFNPLDTGMASGKSSVLKISPETRIYNKCYSTGDFGKQGFSVSQKSGFLSTWPEPSGEITIQNKYIFSDSIEQGTDIYFFSKPFNFPFKVSELIFMSTEQYCFVNAPDFIKSEVSELGIKNINTGNCTGKEVNVCFDNQGKDCNISVYGDCTGNCDYETGKYESGHTIKNGKTMYYTGSMIYGTIFADSEVYNCNFKRLMLRIKQICYLYNDEANFLATRGCGNAITSNLMQFAQTADNAQQSSQSILLLKDAKEALDSQNSKQLGCGIY